MGPTSKKRDTLQKHTPVVISDDRFTHALTDPIFRRVPKKEKKIDIDKRFQSMFHNEKFQLKSSVDKRGRPIDLSTNEDLRQYYNLVDADPPKESEKSGKHEDEADDQSESTDNEGSGNDIEGNIVESDIGKNDTNTKLSKTIKKKLRDPNLDFARGDGVLAEESSDSDSTDDEIDMDDTVHAWGELDRDSERTEESTSRLALCNSDWDRLKAVDLMVLFHSFLPPGGVLKSVNIYTSEYGKQRLAEEDAHGPLELRKTDSDSESESDADQPNNTSLLKKGHNGDDDDGGDYHMEKLRRYQLNRLKYFYCVLEFDSIATAEKVYNECDGMEYESSASRVDLRFIPESMVFEDKPTDSCDSLPLAEKYRPRFFTTTALQQAKVTLTWDETDPLRRELTQKVHNPKEKIDDEDLRAYLASSESEDEFHEEGGTDAGNNMDKYRALLNSIDSKDKKEKEDMEMEITWGVGLKEKTESLVKKKVEEQAAATLTPWEEILAKKKEKRKMKKTQQKLESKTDLEASEDQEAFSDDDIEVDMNDPFFREEVETNEILKAGLQKKKKDIPAKLISEKMPDSSQNGGLELLLMDDNDEKQHFNFKKIVDTETESKGKKKRNRKTKKPGNDTKTEAQDTFEVDVADNRFSALFSSHLYNVDPSDPNFKKTRGMSAIIEEKQKRRSDQVEKRDSEATHQPDEASSEPKIPRNELAYLVKSVKRNTERLKRKDPKRK